MPSTLISWMLLLLDSTASTPRTAHTFEGTLIGFGGVSSPTGGFAGTWGREMLLLGGHIAFPIGHTPLQAGFEFNYGIMGSRTADVITLQDESADRKGTLDARSKVLGYMPLMRFSPFHGKVRPYIDGLLGVREFSTTSTMRMNDAKGGTHKRNELTDAALSKGWAAGIMLLIGDVGVVDLRAETIDGGSASYVDPASITVDDQGVITFDTLTSRTDVVDLVLGIGLRF